MQSNEDNREFPTSRKRLRTVFALTTNGGRPFHSMQAVPAEETSNAKQSLACLASADKP